jgi:hypothetical protein
MNLWATTCLSSFRDLPLAKPLGTSYVRIVGQAIVASLAFIPPPNGVPFWWGHSAVLGKKIMEILKQQYEGMHMQIMVAESEAIAFYQKCGFTKAGKTEPMWIYAGGDS